MYRIINIKKDNPNVEFAIFTLLKEIDYAKKEETNILIVVHGYGSNGKGGLIKKEVARVLEKLKKNKQIVNFVLGEFWGDTNDVKKEICSKFPDLILCDQLNNVNNGCSVVWVK